MARPTTSRDGRGVADQARYMLQGQEISADTDLKKPKTFELYFDRKKKVNMALLRAS